MRHLIFALALVLTSTSVSADNLYRPGKWTALAADHKASQVGDIVTLLVVENDQASNSVTQRSRKRNRLEVGLDTDLDVRANADGVLDGSYEGEGTNSRSDRMVARLSLTVAEVYPNGDMRVTGMQRLKINGDSTLISLNGRVRPVDIAEDNSVLSWRLADAVIDYDGKGFATRSAKPGILTEIFGWLGLL